MVGFLLEIKLKIVKVCPQCGKQKSLKEYYRDKKRKYRVSYLCKLCSQKRRHSHTLLWREKNKKIGLCISCGKRLIDIKHSKNYCSKCLIRKSTQQKIRRQKMKDEVFKHYGGYKCVCCGETEPLFLTMDHINGGGRKHRRLVTNGKGGVHFYKWLKKNNYPNEYQILCFNCNSGRYRNKGICPHKAMLIGKRM